MDIKSAAERLATIGELAWGRQIFRQDFFNARLSGEQRDEIVRRSMLCGSERAWGLNAEYAPGLAGYLACQGIRVHKAEECDDAVPYLMAQFLPPDEIRYFEPSLNAIYATISSNGLEWLLNGCQLEEIVIAHEIFHYIENREPGIYTRQKLLPRRLGPLNMPTQLMAPSEIAAMTFAKELLRLPHNPNIFSYLLLCASDPGRGARMEQELLY